MIESRSISVFLFYAEMECVINTWTEEWRRKVLRKTPTNVTRDITEGDKKENAPDTLCSNSITTLELGSTKELTYPDVSGSICIRQRLYKLRHATTKPVVDRKCLQENGSKENPENDCIKYRVSPKSKRKRPP